MGSARRFKRSSRFLLWAVLVTFYLGNGESASASSVVPDHGFGVQGKVTLDGFTNPFKRDLYQINSLAIGGPTAGPTITDTVGSAIHLNSGGVVDSDYGMAIHDEYQSISHAGWATDLDFDSQGRAVGISAYPFGLTHSSWIFRLTRNGKTDRTFGRRGFVEVANNFYNRPDFARQTALEIDQRGRYVVGGRTEYGRSITVRRYLSNARLDQSFSGDGVWRGSPGWNGKGGSFGGLALRDNKIYVVGSGPDRLVVTRLTEKGFVDRGFGDDGFFVSNCTSNGCGKNFACVQSCRASNLAFLGDGTFVASNVRLGPNGAISQVYKFRRNGALVRGFGRNGVLTLSAKTWRKAAPRLKEANALWPDKGGIAPIGTNHLVVGLTAKLNGSGWRQVGFEIDGRGRIRKQPNGGLAFSLPAPDGRWSVYSAGPRRFYVSGRAGNPGKGARRDELALYRFVDR